MCIDWRDDWYNCCGKVFDLIVVTDVVTTSVVMTEYAAVTGTGSISPQIKLIAAL